MGGEGLDRWFDLAEHYVFMRSRARAWKELAKRYRRGYEGAVASPGFMLANLVYMYQSGKLKDAPPELGLVGAEALGWVLQDLLNKHPEAPNYIEVTLSSPSGKNIYVTVQRPDGKTPNQMKDEAIRERDQAERELEALKINVGISECDKVFCDDPGCPKNNPRT